MSTATLALTDSATMLRRDLRRMPRYPSITVLLVGMPIVLLLLFVHVLGGALGVGIGGPSGGRAEYVDYVTPAIVLMTITSAVQGTSISVAMDMTEGIVDRFRTMAVARVSVLTGHVVGMPLVRLPFLGSGFVPTDSMPTVPRRFAEYQPFIPLIETLRGLLSGTTIGNNAAIAVGWCVLIALGGYLWSRKPFNRESTR